jgi:surface antigen
VRHVAESRRIHKLGGGMKLGKNAKERIYAVRDGKVLQCVPFARAASGIELKGNAVNWWDAAAGVYQRGSRPQVGAVLDFRANSRMRLGHVAVVRKVINSREIEVDQANWAWSGKGNVSYGVPVIDVSPRNDWSAVRVALGHGDTFGSVYSTFGFIYDKPDNGVMVANVHQPSGAPSRSLRSYAEVAEAPRQSREHPSYDAPARSLR